MGTLPQNVIARAIARHPHKDGRLWQLRVPGASSGGSAIAQGQISFTLVDIDPVVQLITEREAGFVGQNIVAGDLRLILNGLTPYTEHSNIVCNGETVDVLRVIPVYNEAGVVQQYKIYVRRRPEGSEGS
jgi:hypothetical protein